MRPHTHSLWLLELSCLPVVRSCDKARKERVGEDDSGLTSQRSLLSGLKDPTLSVAAICFDRTCLAASLSDRGNERNNRQSLGLSFHGAESAQGFF